MVLISIVVLLVFGLALIFTEVLFVPGTTFIGLIGVVFSSIGIYFTFSNYGATFGWTVLIINTVLLIWAISYGLKGGIWKRFSLKSKIDSTFNSELKITVKVGDEGKTVSDLRPSGKADFNGQLLEVKTFGTFVKAGTAIHITKLEPNNIFVKTITE